MSISGKSMSISGVVPVGRASFTSSITFPTASIASSARSIIGSAASATAFTASSITLPTTLKPSSIHPR